MIKLNITRGSINKNDDYYAPHEKINEVEDSYTIREYVDMLIKKYCPKNKNKDVMWVLLCDVNPMAIFNSNNVEERYFFVDEDIPLSKIFKSSSIKLHLCYESDRDIDLLSEEYRMRKLNIFYHNR